MARITNYFKTVAREARDIATAAGTVATTVDSPNFNKAVKNVTRQVGETAKAAVSGKKGTTSDKATSEYKGSSPGINDRPATYTSGKKRK